MVRQTQFLKDRRLRQYAAFDPGNIVARGRRVFGRREDDGLARLEGDAVDGDRAALLEDLVAQVAGALRRAAREGRVHRERFGTGCQACPQKSRRLRRGPRPPRPYHLPGTHG